MEVVSSTWNWTQAESMVACCGMSTAVKRRPTSWFPDLSSVISRSLLLVDTLRASKLQAYYPKSRVKTPAIDELLTQARESARRAEALLATGEVDSSLSQRVTELAGKLDQAVRNQKLVAALDDALSWELGQLAEMDEDKIQKAVVKPIEGEESQFQATDELEMAIVPDAFRLYKQALERWGLTVETPVDEATEMIKARPDWLQVQLVAALHLG